jgi:predicted RNase H-like nuclease (RuvC/YqgF family)
MDKNKLNLYGIIICVALLLVAVGTIIKQDAEIHNKNVTIKAYSKQQEKLETDKDVLRKEIKQNKKQIAKLEKELNKIPTDAEIITNSPIVYVTHDDVWRTITQPIEEAINFVQRGDSVIPD